MKKTQSKKRLNPLVIIFFVVLFVYASSLILMLFWGLMTSVKHFQDFNTNKVGFPDFSAWSKYGNLIEGYDNIFANYILFVQNFELSGDRFKTSFYTMFSSEPVEHNPGNIGLLQVLFNTIIFCAGGALLPTFMCCFMGYVCAKYKYKFSTVIYSIVVFVMVMPIVGNAPAMLDFLRRIGFYDTYIGHAIRQCSFTSMYFLVFYAFFSGMSDSYMEAAQMDGASQLQVMLSIATPLAKSFITTVALVLFVACWNDYETPMLYLPTKPNLALGVHYMCTRGAGFLDRVPFRVASLMTLAIPSLVLYIALNEKLMGNISLGGIKE